MKEHLKAWASSCVLWDRSTFFPLPYIPLVSNTHCTHLFTHSWMQACPAHHTAVQVLKTINYSNIPLFPDHHSNLTFWCFTKKREKKLELSQQGAFSLFCVLKSATIFREDLFELTESEFLTTYSKAKSSAPYIEERGWSNSPQRD